jgi:hypothetical protein
MCLDADDTLAYSLELVITFLSLLLLRLPGEFVGCESEGKRTKN